MTLEDARTIAASILRDWTVTAYTMVPREQPDPFMNWEFAPHGLIRYQMKIVQCWVAVRTIQRHLPAPILYHTFPYLVEQGRLKAAGARIVWVRP